MSIIEAMPKSERIDYACRPLSQGDREAKEKIKINLRIPCLLSVYCSSLGGSSAQLTVTGSTRLFACNPARRGRRNRNTSIMLCYVMLCPRTKCRPGSQQSPSHLQGPAIVASMIQSRGTTPLTIRQGGSRQGAGEKVSRRSPSCWTLTVNPDGAGMNDRGRTCGVMPTNNTYLPTLCDCHLTCHGSALRCKMHAVYNVYTYSLRTVQPGPSTPTALGPAIFPSSSISSLATYWLSCTQHNEPAPLLMRSMYSVSSHLLHNRDDL